MEGENMDNKIVSISMTVAEWNVVMNALGGRPFAEVVSIINKIKEQAEPQVQGDTVTEIQEAA